MIFCGTFMGKARLRVGDGKLSILQEGTIRKFVRDVEQITFAGQYVKPGQEIWYITERCVFRLMDGAVTLVELAPGLELERDILAHMDFTPAISPQLKQMPSEIFQEYWGGLGAYLESDTSVSKKEEA